MTYLNLTNILYTTVHTVDMHTEDVKVANADATSCMFWSHCPNFEVRPVSAI